MTNSDDEVMSDGVEAPVTIPLHNGFRPDEREALYSIDAAAAVLLRQGMSAEAVAELMLCEAYHLHAKAQGALRLAEGWPERAHARFQSAVAAFCVEMCNATITDAGDVLLPYFSGRSGRER